MNAITRLREELRRQGGLLAASLAPGALEGDGAAERPAALAASGPRAAGRRDDYELLVELIHEGSELHYGAPRVLAPVDEDLSLLLGDQLYALGLERLAAVGDLESVAELADLISLVAQAAANGDHGLREAAWRAGARAIGWGGSPAHAMAKELARVGDPAAAAALRTAAG
jgi:hypothetical protein